MNASAEPICPKCQGQMRSYERNGITIDQCQECRGIFLDRGELERMIDAEGGYVQRGGAAPPAGGGHGDRGSGSGGKRRKGSFLSELFE